MNTKRNERNKFAEKVTVTAALVVLAIGGVIVAINHDKIFADKAEQKFNGLEIAETSEEYELLETAVETTEAPDYGDVDIEGIYAFSSRVLTSDIQDPDIKARAVELKKDGNELFNLKNEIDFINTYPDYYTSYMMPEVIPQGFDGEGVFVHSDDPSILWNILLFKMNESDLDAYLDNLVKTENEEEGRDVLSSDAFRKTEDADKVVYSQMISNEGSTYYRKYEISFDKTSGLTEVYSEFGGGEG